MPDPTTPPVDSKIRKKAEQDQELANAINAASKLIETARANAEILALLAPRGYDLAALDDALATKVAPAQAGFDARQVAMGIQSSATKALGDAEARERKDFADYHEIARSCFPLAADRLALGLNGVTPADLEKFLTTATASYGAGKRAPYAAKLTVRGYAPASIDAELLGLKGVGSLAKAAANARRARRSGRPTRGTRRRRRSRVGRPSSARWRNAPCATGRTCSRRWSCRAGVHAKTPRREEYRREFHTDPRRHRDFTSFPTGAWTTARSARDAGAGGRGAGAVALRATGWWKGRFA